MSSKLRYPFKVPSGREYYIYRGDAVLNAEKHLAHKWYFISKDLLDVNNFTNEYNTPMEAEKFCGDYDVEFQQVDIEFQRLREQHKQRRSAIKS